MGSYTKTKNKFEGVTNFRVWKKRIDLILLENDILDHLKGKVIEPQDNEGKARYKKKEITTTRIIVKYIIYHLIPYVSGLDSPKKIYDSLVGLYTINNIGKKTNLKNELRDVKTTKPNILASYSMRISQLRDKLQSIDEVIPNT